MAHHFTIDVEGTSIPWEMDDWAPSVAAPRLQLLRMFGGRGQVWQRVEQMVLEFDFSLGRITDTVDAMMAART